MAARLLGYMEKYIIFIYLLKCHQISIFFGSYLKKTKSCVTYVFLLLSDEKRLFIYLFVRRNRFQVLLSNPLSLTTINRMVK